MKIKKNVSKDLLTLLVLAVLFFSLIPGQVFSAGLVPCGGPDEPACQFCHLFVMLAGIITFVLFDILPPLAILMMVIAGVMFFFGGGNPSLLLQAKKLITSIVIGLVIIFSAYLIVGTVLTATGVLEWTTLDKWLDNGTFTVNCPIGEGGAGVVAPGEEEGNGENGGPGGGGGAGAIPGEEEEESKCEDCGIGLSNIICDEAECLSLGDCKFTNTFGPGGKCEPITPTPTTPASDYTTKEEPAEEPIEEPIIEEPAEEPVEEPGTVYPQQWATGDGTEGNPWANNCIQKAYDACPTGGTIFLRAGYYQLSGQLGIWSDSGKAVSFIGEGMGKTIIRTADAVGFAVEHSNVIFKGFTLDGDAQTGQKFGFSLGGNSINVDYLELEDIEVKNCSWTGMNVLQVNHCSFKNIYAHNNGESGIHPGGYVTGRNKYNTYQDIYVWDNAFCGFGDIGIENAAEYMYNTYDNIQAWNNGLHGITLGSSKGVTMTNCISTGNGARGIFIFLDVEDSTFSNCLFANNGTVGIEIQNSKNLNFTNVISKNNATGILLAVSSNITFTSCQSYDDRTPMLQEYGLVTSGTTNYIELTNCILTPNKLGKIYNGAGAVIIEK